jgi:hypothetical protein
MGKGQREASHHVVALGLNFFYQQHQSPAISSNEIIEECKFRYQPLAGSLLPLQITELVSTGKCRNIISYE